ncbi:hypothetical protein MJO28_014243 [Puccinia striiformis f. sp. tritici]|uniref:Uncharacterized protein n=1 Tax=Puccinia striiformis f. sp. tritici TaxID=168172 RepID=A0ACC0DUZ8_9BASI|nr:hypothetical protein MJO28_014243 [Puccinia striiformis f. sp. tritici]
MVQKNSPTNRPDSETPPSATPGHHPSGSYTPAEKLTRADDLMSDVLDCFLWPTHNKSSYPAKRTIKFTPDYRRPRALKINDFKQIIHLVQTGELRNLTEATTVIRQLPAVISYLHNAEPPRLGKHIGLYLQLFLPKCGVRFCETDRYDQSRQAPTDEQVHSDIQLPSSHCSSLATQSPSTSKRQRSKIRANELRDLLGSSQSSSRDSPGPSRRGSTRSGEPYSRARNVTHLAVFAARDYVPNDIVMGCEGSFADLTEEEDLKLRSNAHLPAQADRSTGAAPRESTDFSHIVNSRGKFQVFCGPARFVNHDCENNAILLREGFTIRFKVTKSIKAGEEILTNYGMNYFGERNCECMCGTCQRNGKGFYSQEEIDSNNGDNEQLVVEQQNTPIKNEFEDHNKTVPGLSTGADESSLLALSEGTTSLASNTPALEQSPTISYSTTPSQVRRQLGLASQPQSALADHRSTSRSSSTRRGRPTQSDHQNHPRTSAAAFISPAKLLPTQDLTLSIFALPETKRAQSNMPFKQLESPPTSQPVGKSSPSTGEAPTTPVQRKTYWITTKQKQLGLVPWGDETDMPAPSTSQPYSPLTPSMLGPSRRKTDRAPPRQKRKAATEPRPERLPARSYWVSTKEKQLGILPWGDNASDGSSEPTAHTARPTRSTRASRRASEHMNAVVDFPTAPRGSKLSYKVFQEGSQEAEMLSTAIGRELLGFRPRVTKKNKVTTEEVDSKTASTDDHQLASPDTRVDLLNDQDGDALMVPFEEIASFLLRYPGDEPVGPSQSESNGTKTVEQQNRTEGEVVVEKPIERQPSTVASTSCSPSTCKSSTSPKPHSRSRHRTIKDVHLRPPNRPKRSQQKLATSLPSSPSSSCLSSTSQPETSRSSALPPPINSLSEPPKTLPTDTTTRLENYHLPNDILRGIQPKNDPTSSSESRSAAGHRLLVSSIG